MAFVRRRTLQRQATLGRLTVLLVFLAAWELGARVGWLDANFTSSPSRVMTELPASLSDPDVLSALAGTAGQILLAFAGGAIGGLAVGVSLGLSSVLRGAYLAPLLFILATPKTAFLPLFIILFGIGPSAAVAFGMFSAFFYVVVNVVAGVDLVEEKHRRIARAFRASRWNTFRHVVLPAAMPGVITGLWHGTKHAMGGVLIAQLFVALTGVGLLFRNRSTNGDVDGVMALTIIIGFAAILVGSVWTRLEARQDRWRRGRGTLVTEVLDA